MRCVKCGMDCPDQVKYCSRCGNILNIQENRIKIQAVHQMSVKRMSGKKLTAVAAIAGVLLILIGALIIHMASDQSVYTYHDSSSIQAISIIPEIPGYEKITFVTGDGTLLADKMLTTYTDCQSNLSQSIYGVLNQGDLFLVTKKGFEEILQEVDSFTISADGTALAYTVTDVTRQTTLYVYDISSKKSIRIADGVKNGNYVISPDGTYVAFIKDYVSDQDYKLCICKSGKELEVIGMNKLPLAIADDAKYLYYLDNSKLIVRSHEEALRLSAEFSGIIMFNESNTEILFSDEDKTFLSAYGQEKQKICNKQLESVILPDSICRKMTSKNFKSYMLGTKHLTGLVYRFDTSFYYLSASLELAKLCECNVKDYAIAEENTKFLFSDGQNLYYIEDIQAAQPEPVTIIEHGDIGAFLTDSELSYVYYVNHDDELIYQPINGTGKKIADEVKEGFYYMDWNNEYVYFLTDTDRAGVGRLYYSKEGSDKKAVAGASEVSLASYGGNVYYRIDEEDSKVSLMLLKKGKAVVAKSE